MNPDFTGFVLAGGKSSRMGADKFSLEFGGESFLKRAVNVLKTVCAGTKIALNQTQSVETNLPVVRDVYAERGALGGIHAALKSCETKFAFILAVDLPFVTTGAVENLIKIALSSNKFTAFVPRQTDGRLQPLCAVYRAKYCLPPLERVLNENNKASVRDFLALVAPQYVDQNRLSDNEDLLFNVNSPADLQSVHSSTD